MKPKAAAMGAIVAYVTGQALRIVTITFVLIMALVFAGVWALAYYVSEWWWLLLLPLLVIVLLFLLFRLTVKRIAGLIHRHPFTTEQREQLETFTSKVWGLTEARTTSLPMYALITLRDIIRDRDATTLRKMAKDSGSLKDDFAELEKKFGER